MQTSIRELREASKSPNINLRNKGMIPAVSLGGHFKYLGKIFDFESLNSVPKKDFEAKLENIMVKLSSL